MLLEIQQVSKLFGGLQALSQVSFNVNEGEILGLIGPNGSGKSTLFNVITGTLPPSAGTIHFLGQAITGLSAHAIARRGIGRTFQSVRPFMELSVLQNVMAGALYGKTAVQSHRAAQAKAYEMLELVKLSKSAHLPARQLNVMSRKWLEIARALATEPKLLLLDELMAGLNPSEVHQAVEFIKRLKDFGITVIVVEHIMKAIMNCSDRIVVLNAGRKIAEGAPAAIIEDPQVISAYLGSSYAEAR